MSIDVAGEMMARVREEREATAEIRKRKRHSRKPPQERRGHEEAAKRGRRYRNR